MQKLPELILVGSLSIDRIMNFRGRYKDLIKPDKIHVLSLSILLDSLQHTRGGIAANIAYNLALLGEKPVLLTAAGHDASEYIKDLGSMNIDTSRVYFNALPTSSFTVMTDLDDNQIGGFYPGSMSDSAPLTLEPWTGTDAIVVVSPYDPATMNRLVGEAAEFKLRLIYDIGQQVSNVPAGDLTRGLELAEVLFVNDYEMGVLISRTGLTQEQILNQVPVVVTTLGAKGSLIQGKSIVKHITIPAAPVDQVVDPTGAGDAYRAGFLYGYMRGADLTVCGRLGAITASYAVEVKGTQEHRFTLADMADRYYSTYRIKLNL